jgi:glycosyltransferase involved in cell wall biosynthesis
MRILIWADAFWPGVGGLEVFCMNLVRGLTARGHVCEVIANRDNTVGERLFEFEGVLVHGFAFRETLVRGAMNALKRQNRTCHRIVEEFQPDVIHLHGLSRSLVHFISQQNRRRLPAVATLHDNLLDRDYGTMAGNLFSKIDRIAAVSAYIRGEVLAFDPALKARTVTVRNALPGPAIAPSAPPGTPRLLVASRLFPEKAVDLAIEAFFQIAPRFPEATLTVASDGPEREKLEKLVRASSCSDRVTFPGLIAPDQMHQLISEHAIVLMPSTWQEPFGLIALEAAQMGRPVIASRVGGLPEIVVEGVTGLFHERGDLAGLAQALTRLLDDPVERDRMGRDALKHAATFSFERLISHYEQLYAEARAARAPQGPGETPESSARVFPSRVPLPPVLPLLWEGAPFAHHSFGVVSREIGRAMLGRPEIDFTYVPYERDHFDPLQYPEYAPLAALVARNKKRVPSPLKPILVRLQFPLRAVPAPGMHWVVYHPWEYTRSAKVSVEIMNRAKEVWTTSTFALESLVRSGVPREKTHVIPNGVDLDIFRVNGPRAEIPTEKPFRFLFVGGTIFRKGVDILLKAYGKAFTAADPVTLVIKDYGANPIYPFEQGAYLIAEFRKNPAHPEVVHLPAHRNDREMAELYRACDVFVSSYRGEGFCLPALESMACGRPVIVTAGGSTDDFVPPAAGWHIPAPLVSFGNEIHDEPADGEVELFEPDVDALVELLRRAHRDEADRRLRGVAAHRTAQAWSWDDAADKIIARCRALSFTGSARSVSP